MIYEINKKLYFKVENYYAEVEVTRDSITPAKPFVKIYCEDVNPEDIKVYNSLQEYNENNKKRKFVED